MKIYVLATILSVVSVVAKPSIATDCDREPVMISAIKASYNIPRGSCVDVQASQWYSVFRGLTPYSHKPTTDPIISGMPDYMTWGKHNYVPRPSTMTDCELEQAHVYCIDRINQYRTGFLKFSNGKSDTTVPSLLRTSSSYEKCSNEEALGDLVVSYVGKDTGETGGCVGAHANAFKCPKGLYYTGQNSCCSNGDGAWGDWDTTKFTTYVKVVERIDACLQAMWDEGQGVDPICCETDCSVNGGPKWYTIGHWCNMRNKNAVYVSCGFAFTEEGRIVVNQNFGSAFAPLPTPSPTVPTFSPTPQPTLYPTVVFPTYSPVVPPSLTPTSPPSTRRPIGPPTKRPTKKKHG